MIEFTGYLTANALKHYQRRSIRLTRVFLALLFSMCVSGLFYANFWFGKQISAITAVSAKSFPRYLISKYAYYLYFLCPLPGVCYVCGFKGLDRCRSSVADNYQKLKKRTIS